jgi:hypothetical protein
MRRVGEDVSTRVDDRWTRGGRVRVSAQTHRCPKFGPWMGVSSPPDTFGSARWVLFFWPLCSVGQKRTRGIRLGQPAGDALIPGIFFVPGSPVVSRAAL